MKHHGTMSPGSSSECPLVKGGLTIPSSTCNCCLAKEWSIMEGARKLLVIEEMYFHIRPLVWPHYPFSPGYWAIAATQSCLALFTILLTVASQALSIGFFQQEYRSGCHFLQDLPHPGSNPHCLPWTHLVALFFDDDDTWWQMFDARLLQTRKCSKHSMCSVSPASHQSKK